MKPAWVIHFEEILCDWKNHTLDEEQAIESQDWTQLTMIQESKQALMQAFEQLADQGQHEEVDLQKWLTPQMSNLHQMERKNADLLAKKQAHVHGQIEQSRSSGRQLNRIKSAYTVNKDSVMIKAYS